MDCLTKEKPARGRMGYSSLASLTDSLPNCTTSILLKLPSLIWATKHPLAWCQIAADQTPTALYHPKRWHSLWWGSCYGLSKHPCGLLWRPLCHLRHPKNFLLWLCHRGISNPHPKTNDNPQTRATPTWDWPHNSLVSSLRQTPARGSAHISECPLLVTGGGAPIDIHNDHDLWLWCRNVGQLSWYAAAGALDCYGKGRMNSQNLLGQSHVSEGKETEDITRLDRLRHIDEIRN